jgi:alanine racemase
MKRLGFEVEDATRVLQVIQSQPEVYVKSIYTHLADADNRRDKRFTSLQVQRFMTFSDHFAEGLPYSFDRHVLNSDGIANYSAAQFELVRIGIGMYGISSHPTLKRSLRPVLSWKSTISQVKQISKGESVGYGRTFRAKDEHSIAIIPVGYADGYARCLSNGKGGVYIQNTFCPTVGRVCMDMIMVDVTGLDVNSGEDVEIIGKHQTIEDLAAAMGTIPYEVMTGIADRVHRIYLES